MSFDIFLQCFQNGRAINLPDEMISALFLEHRVGASSDVFILEYPDGSRSDLSMLQQTPSCLYWPGDGPVIAQTFVRNHLPVTMIEKLGAPILVSTPEQIIAAIKNS